MQLFLLWDYPIKTIFVYFFINIFCASNYKNQIEVKL